MKTKTSLSMLLVVVLSVAMMGCPGPGNTNQTPTPTPTPSPSPTPSAQVCVDFEPPLVAGTQYGQPVGQPNGTVIFTTNGIPVSIHDFVFVGSGGTFNLAQIEVAPVPFGSGQSIRSNNINLEFNFSAIGFTPSQVTFEYLDLGGFENISVNGNPSPPFAGEFSAAPNPIGGAGIAVTSTPVQGGRSGTVTLTGAVTRLRVGGQELWLDQVCARR